MGPDVGAAPCSADKPLESRMLRRRLTSSSYLRDGKDCRVKSVVRKEGCGTSDEGVDARMVDSLLNDLGVPLFEVVKVVLHHVDFADLLRDCAKKEERVKDEQLSCQAGDA